MPNVCKSSIFWAKSNTKCMCSFLPLHIIKTTDRCLHKYIQADQTFLRPKLYLLCKQLVIVILGISLYFIQIKIHKKIAIKQRYFINFVKHRKQ